MAKNVVLNIFYLSGDFISKVNSSAQTDANN